MGRPITEQLKEGQCVAGASIATLNNSSTSSSGLDMRSGPGRVRGILHCGTLTGAASVDFKAQASATLAGTYTDITAATTSPAITGIVTDDSWNSIEIRRDQMPTGKPFLKFKATETATANAVVDIIVIGDCADYSPLSDYDTVTWTNNIVTMP